MNCSQLHLLFLYGIRLVPLNDYFYMFFAIFWSKNNHLVQYPDNGILKVSVLIIQLKYRVWGSNWVYKQLWKIINMHIMRISDFFTCLVHFVGPNWQKLAFLSKLIARYIKAVLVMCQCVYMYWKYSPILIYAPASTAKTLFLQQ